MNQEDVTTFYKLNELEQILAKCEDDISSRIEELELKETEDNLNFLLYTIGKSFVTTREIILLCWSGFPDGALALARNIYEQLIITLYIEKNSEQASLTDILHRYNADYSFQRAKCLKYEAQYLSKDKDQLEKYQSVIDEIRTQNNIKKIKDYWWAAEKGTSFLEICESVIEDNKEMEPLLRLMHLMYKRACLSLHSSCMGNRIRLGSDCSGIDMGPWEKGQENALFLSTASLVYIVSVTYQAMGLVGDDVNKSLNELTIYYHDIIMERAKKELV